MIRKKWIVLLPYYLLTVTLIIGAAHLGSQTVTTIAQTSAVDRENRIIIDAGHGGIDGGASSCTGALESMINLEIALKLNDLIRFLGYDTVMIRTTDTSIHIQGQTIAAQKVSDLKERVRIANETEGGILISIHQNTFSDSRYGGAQVFYGNADGSKILANQLQNAIISTINPGSNRKCKASDGIYLMQNISCPGVLIECGFLSNPEEEANLRKQDYQQKLCCVIASSISLFIADKNH